MDEPAIVGRTTELQWLVDRFSEVQRSHRGGMVVVHGPAGSGTSRLARGLADELRRRGLGHQWWEGRCSRAAEVAYAPMVAVLRPVAGGAEQWLAEAAEVGHAAPDSVAAAMLAGLHRRLRTASSSGPLVVLVDDVDASDRSTRQLLEAVGPLLDDVPVLVIAAGRSRPDGAPPIEGATHALAVSPLGDADALELLASSGAQLDRQELGAILEACAGRPALLVRWSSGPIGAGAAWNALSALNDRFGAEASTAVAVASLADGWLSDIDLTAIAAVDRDVLGTLLDAGVLERRAAGGLAPRSDLWADASLAAAGDQRAGLSRSVAAALPPPAPDALRARLWEQTGDRVEAARWWERAAHDAIEHHAVATAADALSRALELGGRDVAVREARRAAEWALWSGDRAGVVRIVRAALPWIPRTDAATVCALLVIQHRALFEIGDPEADAALDAALAVGGAGAPAVDALVLDTYRRVAVDVAEAGARVDAAIDMARRLDDHSAIASALGAKAVVEGFAGRFGPAGELFDEAIQHAATADAVAEEARLASNRVYTLWRAGRMADVERLADLELERLRARGLEVLGDQLALMRAIALTQLGRLHDARRAIDRTVAINVAADTHALADLLSAEIAVIDGRTNEARSMVERVRDSPVRDIAAVAGELALRAVEIAMAAEDWSGAMAAAQRGRDAAGDADTVALARLDLAHARAALRAQQTHTASVSAQSRVALDVGAGREEVAIGMELRAIESDDDDEWRDAISGWTALPAPIEAWHCGLGLAVRRRDAGALAELVDTARSMGAHGLARLAESAWRDAGGRRTGRRTVGDLTEREADVLALLAQGLTNKDIAVRLGLSPRTVGVHVQHCCTKLGVSTRGAAVHEARRRGLLGE